MKILPIYAHTTLLQLTGNNITGQIINVDSGQRLAWKTPDIINTKE